MRLNSTFFAYSIILILCSSCSNHSSNELPDYIHDLENVTIHDSDPQPKSSIKLTALSTFGYSDEVPLGQISHVDIDNLGNVYIADRSSGNEAIYVFDSQGNYINKIGRSGEGPGEFRFIGDMKITNNKLIVLDQTLLRIQIFNTHSHDLVGEARLDPAQWDKSEGRSFTYPANIFALNDSTLLTAFYHMTFNMDTKSYYYMDLKGNVISDRIQTHDFIKHLKNSSDTWSIFDPFGGRGFATLSSENEMFTVWSEHMLFKVYDADGSYLRAFYHPFKKSVLSRSEALDHIDHEQFRNALQNNGIPTYRRAFDHLIMDDKDRLWVSTITDNQEIYEWWLMDNHGNLIAKIELPRTNEIQIVKNNFLYALETDVETGSEQIVKYQLEY